MILQRHDYKIEKREPLEGWVPVGVKVELQDGTIAESGIYWGITFDEACQKAAKVLGNEGVHSVRFGIWGRYDWTYLPHWDS